MPWVRRPRRRPKGEPVPEGPGVGPPPNSVDAEQMRSAHPRRLRRERRLLARRREIEIRDVGGLTVEMIRRDRFRPELLHERANDVLQLEQRMHEVDGLLTAVAAAPRGLRAMPTCRCGAPLLPGAHFCSNCGRPSAAAPAVQTCSHCGQPLPAEANFCTACGNPFAPDDVGGGEDLGDTLIRRWSAGDET